MTKQRERCLHAIITEHFVFRYQIYVVQNISLSDYVLIFVWNMKVYTRSCFLF
jgi:hypothetical protein